MRWANLLANDLGHSAHLLPNSNCRHIHIEQTHLVSTLSPETIDADCIQESSLSGFNQVRRHAHGWCILDVLHLFRTLRDDLIVQRSLSMFRNEVT